MRQTVYEFSKLPHAANCDTQSTTRLLAGRRLAALAFRYDIQQHTMLTDSPSPAVIVGFLSVVIHLRCWYHCAALSPSSRRLSRVKRTFCRCYRTTFRPNFHIISFRANFVFPYCPIFSFQILECEAFQIFCPLLNFQTLEPFSVFPASPVFLAKRGESAKKKSFDKNGPNLRHALPSLQSNTLRIIMAAIS